MKGAKMTKHNMHIKYNQSDFFLFEKFSLGAVLFYGLFAIISLLPDVALAGFVDPTNTPLPGTSIPTPGQTLDPVTSVFLQVIYAATGTAGKAICTLAVIVAGVAALLGKISWGQGLIIAAGVALVFGCMSIMNSIVGGSQGSIVTPGTLTCSMPFGSAISGIAGFSPIAAPGVLFTPLNPACGMMVKLVNTIQGELGAGIGSLFVLFLGFAALFGRVSWPQAAVLAAGIGLIFGAATIVNMLWLQPEDCNLQVGGIVASLANPGAMSPLQAALAGVTPEFVICQFLMILQGYAGKMMATLAVIIMGFLAMLGRISWQYAVVVMVGIACVFGSHQILSILIPGSVGISCMNTITGWGAYALPLGPIEKVLCDIHQIITGPVGKALGSCAIIMLGFGAMIGKVSYHAALVVAIGITITFGAPQIVMYLTLAVDVCIVPSGTIILPTAAAQPTCSALLGTIFR
jgi:type IV secretion system protein VirB2